MLYVTYFLWFVRENLKLFYCFLGWISTSCAVLKHMCSCGIIYSVKLCHSHYHPKIHVMHLWLRGTLYLSKWVNKYLKFSYFFTSFYIFWITQSCLLPFRIYLQAKKFYSIKYGNLVFSFFCEFWEKDWLLLKKRER